MNDIAKRFPQNPILRPVDMKSSRNDLQITCLLNPGVFKFAGKIWLLVRVAERPAQSQFSLSFPIKNEQGEIQLMEIQLTDADLIATDARVINWKGADYLTTLSHLRLLSSADGIHFSEMEEFPALHGIGALETFGIEDCRVSCIDGLYYLTYTAVSSSGVGIGMRTTRDWKNFAVHGMVLPPHNKDCAIFERRINGKLYAFHRPSSIQLGGNYIWLMESLDGVHWGNHQCIAKTRKGKWDSARVGAGAAPIETPDGWLEIYHGADATSPILPGCTAIGQERPCDYPGSDSTNLLWCRQKAMRPAVFFGHVVYTNGHILQADKETLTIYYGAADEYVCGATFNIREILNAITKI